ncbi:MAG: cytochrome d ubiquinol oxidase subunit II [Planctomycetes bacterium]|nr:cytochrome d ubiquinol oxidase subunit II [Planctomycetota bacterium]
METIWFGISAFVLTMYVVLDGFDFGAGALHLFVARDDRARRQVLSAIGPFWDGNEVWLLAGGGVLFLAFPAVLASVLSGFYLAIMLVLWVLVLRGIALEFRSHLADRMWRAFWDGTFWIASTLAPVLFGAALGNLVRGVPLDADGWFALPLFASWTTTGELGILDWYTVLTGVLALVAIVHHGALFLAWKTDGVVRARSLVAARVAFPVLVLLWIAVSAATEVVVPGWFDALLSRPVAWAGAVLLVAGLVVSARARATGRDRAAFLGSCAFLLGALGATAAALHPVLVRAAGDASRSFTVENAAADPASLAAGLRWWPAGCVLALGYFALLFRLHRGKIALDDVDD